MRRRIIRYLHHASFSIWLGRSKATPAFVSRARITARASVLSSTSTNRGPSACASRDGSREDVKHPVSLARGGLDDSAQDSLWFPGGVAGLLPTGR